MAIHWQIPFKSLRTGTDYCVNIYDANFSGTAVVLKGGAEPFETSEDNTDDEFTPIRKQSGYIRIVDDGKTVAGGNFNYKNLLPDTDTARPVTLTKTVSGVTTIVWQGFMQAQTFGSTLYEKPQEREFPVQCPLSILQGTDINYTQKERKNFAYLLNYIIDSIPTLSISKIYVQGMSASDWLLKMIDWQNFVSEDSDGNLEARFNLYRCLEDMCQFWGWTARTYADMLFLTQADNTTNHERENWLELTKANLVTMAGGSTAGTTISNFPYVTISSEAIFANFENSESLNRGPNKVVVTSDINEATENIIDTTTDQYEKQLTDQGWGSKTTGNDGATRYTNDKQSISLPYLTGTATSGKASFNMGRVWDKDGNKTDVSMIRMKAAYNGNVYATLQTVYEHCYSGNTLTFSVKAYNGYTQLPGDSLFSTVIVSKVRIGIGKTRATAKWLGGGSSMSWSTTETIVKLEYDKNGNTWIVIEDGGQDYFHSFITIASGLAGILFIEFLGTESTIDIADFSVQMFHNASANTSDPDDTLPGFYENGELEYKATNGNDVQDEQYVDNIYGSDGKVAFGYGIISNPNGTFFKDWYDTGSGAVEQMIANRIVSYWSKSRLQRVINVLPGISLPIGLGSNTILSENITPLYQVVMDVTYHPVAISHSWRDDITSYTLQEIPAE